MTTQPAMEGGAVDPYETHRLANKSVQIVT